MKQLVIGLGEVGGALREVLACDGLDAFKGVEAGAEKYDVIHIAFPYAERFVGDVKAYQERFLPALTVIHSTVPLGTSRALGAVHSPVRGIHPHMVEGLRTFVKFFGGDRAAKAAALFEAVGVRTWVADSSESAEAMKLWDTLQYGVNIMLEKEIHAYCQRHGLDFDFVYREANRTYNEGYEALGRPEYKKYVLSHRDGPVGGHCVINNCRLIDTPAAKRLIEENEKLAD